MIVHRVTCNLPIHLVSIGSDWSHLKGLSLADPTFGLPSAVDILLGVDVFAEALLQGRRSGPPDSPTALETEFGWVLAGTANKLSPTTDFVSHHVSVSPGDDLLQKFWEIEETPPGGPVLSIEEKAVVHHFESSHCRDADGVSLFRYPRSQIQRS